MLNLISANDFRDIVFSLHKESETTQASSQTIRYKIQSLKSRRKGYGALSQSVGRNGVMTSPVEACKKNLRILRLAETAKELPTLLRSAESANWTYHELLHEILSYELDSREQKSIEKLMKWANFPYQKTLDDYRLDDQKAVGERQFKQLKQLHWIEEYFTLILLGPPGVGKTHLAVGLGIEAINQWIPGGFCLHGRTNLCIENPGIRQQVQNPL